MDNNLRYLTKETISIYSACYFLAERQIILVGYLVETARRILMCWAVSFLSKE